MPLITTTPGRDGRPRCSWCAATPGYEAYHDQEWGFPVGSDTRLFEKLCLEGFQAGLSWRTILEKRDNFRRAFDGFEFHKLAHYTDRHVQALLQDAGIVRHRGKIEAAIHNARCAVALQAECGTLAAYFWRYEPRPARAGATEVLAQSPESQALSKNLKKRGFKFVGPTTVYAFMQAMGLVNDHAPACVVAAQVVKARKAFATPQ